MIYKQRGGYNKNSSHDKPGMDFGIALLDDSSVQKALESVAPALKRNFVHMELKSNLLAAERSKVLSRFPSSNFTKVAVVVMGEPPEDFKAKTYERMLADKEEEAKRDKRRNADSRKRKARDEEPEARKGGDDEEAKGNEEGE